MKDPLLLENQLCFPLYAAAKEVVRCYRPFLDPLGLTYTQYIAMMALWEHKVLTINQLGKLLYLDSGTLTPMLKKMEQAGLLVRRRSETDERSVVINLTPKGEALREQAVNIPDEMAQYVKLNANDTIQLYHLLHRLLGNHNAVK
ncbi:MAG: MarR family transcriptional regulator [Tidjanibacter sp.]|nr:MarR family transcriptional regulator [Tidjanibacter sp.]MBR6813339.1 MarR family transcriptional regulator [Tidjanibacter sp.]